jgi:hypothetical protein
VFESLRKGRLFDFVLDTKLERMVVNFVVTDIYGVVEWTPGGILQRELEVNLSYHEWVADWKVHAAMQRLELKGWG